VSRVNISQTPIAAHAAKFHGRDTPPPSMSLANTGKGLSSSSASSGCCSPSSVSPNISTRATRRPACRWRRNCRVASISSREQGIWISMAAAPTRHSVHKVPMTMGWMTILPVEFSPANWRPVC
jgi:hypothetical protein